MVNSKESDEVLDHANNIGSASEDEVRGMCWISAQNYWDDNLILMLLFKVFSVAVDPLIDWLFAVSFTLSFRAINVDIVLPFGSFFNALD